MKVLWSEQGGFGSDSTLTGREVDLEDLLIDIIKGGAHVGTACAIARLVTLLAEKKVISLQEVQDVFGMSWNLEQLREIKADKKSSG